MSTLYFISALIAAIVSAAYLQLPTFVLELGYSWFHNYKFKRWILRLISILCIVLFVTSTNSVIITTLGIIPIAFFIIFSLVNANPKVYIALTENQIIKKKQLIYPIETEVLGYVDLDGNAICYPVIEMIMPRHLLNDTFFEKPLFISYCAACRSSMVYIPIANNKRLTFEVLGVYRRNMVMRDLETGTIWQQGTGQAMYGELKGSQMEYLPYQQTTLGEWLKAYPESFVAMESDNIPKGLFSKEKLMKMLKITESKVMPGRTNLDGLALREKVWGIEINGYSKTYPVSELRKIEKIYDKIGQVDICIKYNRDNNMIVAKEVNTSKMLKPQSHWWFGWKEFHPKTEIWKAQ